MKKAEKLPVIIRSEGPDEERDVVAIFPTLVGSVLDPNTMTCYELRGAHATCSAGYIGRKTKPATKKQIAAMLKALRRAGYKNLKVVSRASTHHRAARARRNSGLDLI